MSQTRLDVKEMLGVYMVLSAGIFLSIVAVGGEIWWSKGLGEKIKGRIKSFKK